MKVLIWVLCFLVNVLITVCIKGNGIILGGIPTAVMFGGTLWLARTLCKKWDEYNETQKALELKGKIRTQPKIVSINGRTIITVETKIGYCRKCGEKLIDNSRFCRKCGTEIVEEIDIMTEEPEITILELENIEFCEKCGANITDDIDTCHVCGERIHID